MARRYTDRRGDRQTEKPDSTYRQTYGNRNHTSNNIGMVGKYPNWISDGKSNLLILNFFVTPTIVLYS